VTDQRFEELVAEAMDRIRGFFREEIPELFHEETWNVALVVEDEPSPEVLAELGIEPPDTLYGLYEGTSMTEREWWGQTTQLPNRVIIFRNPILEDAEDEDDVVRAVGETVIHEFGHHFGFSEEQIDEVEALWAEDFDDDGVA